ncbi:MAG TPA: hypothetical protein VNF27_02630 [Candidatus Binataceae bacterium]|nr:hypothetical protein [Candidatus Binataceae bacterium]
MKFRHAAALALVGWYLMLAPRTSDKPPITYDTTAPLSKWKIVGSYDTAKECDQGKDKIPRIILQAEENMTSEQKSAYDQTILNLLGASQCIATDDPRLKEK